MKLIIDISDKTYEIIRDMMYFYNPQRSGRAETKEIITAIKQGTPLEEKLEKIKAEIEEDKKLYSYNEHIQKGHSNCIDIVNSHISELKGE